MVCAASLSGRALAVARARFFEVVTIGTRKPRSSRRPKPECPLESSRTACGWGQPSAIATSNRKSGRVHTRAARVPGQRWVKSNEGPRTRSDCRPSGRNHPVQPYGRCMLANPAAQIGTQLGYQLIWSRGSAGTEFREYDSFHLGAFPEQLTAGSAPTSAAQVVTAVLLSRSC